MMFAEAMAFTFYIDNIAAGVIGTTVGGAITFVVRMILADRAANRSDYKEMFTAVAAMNRELGTAVATNSVAIMNLLQKFNAASAPN